MSPQRRMDNSEEMELSFNKTFFCMTIPFNLQTTDLCALQAVSIGQCQKVHLMLQYEVCRNCWKLCTFQIKSGSCVLSCSLTFEVHQCNVCVIFHWSSSLFNIWHVHHLMRIPVKHSSVICSAAGLFGRPSYLGNKNKIQYYLWCMHSMIPAFNGYIK
jgi:hypothetical protein